MADVAVVILRVVAEIRDVAQGIKENDRQARRLFKRVLAVEPPVLAVREGTKLSSSEALRQLLATVEKIRNFLKGYAQTSKFNRALKRKANADKFSQLGVILTEGMQALQLDVAVDAWAKEDASDRLADLENMVDMMEKMERSRTDNHAEVMSVLKALRNDERAELKGWVEIDYGADLDFEGSTILGSGAFGEVRTAKWNGVDVAVKHLLVHGAHANTVRALRKEIRLHSSLNFEHVVQLYAASTVPPHLCLVIELAEGGSLQDYLYSTPEPLEHALQTAFLFDIARGMSFLHSKGILHRDLKSANVLMFANRRLKLCDFGLSKVKSESSSRSKRGAVGTAQWMSPEEMDESPSNELTDVYSFGVVCFEVATRMEPFKGLKQPQVTRAVADKGKRPQIPEEASASPDVVPLMERCWKQDPADRPEGFGPVVQALGSVVSRDGDPRMLSAAAVDFTPSSGAKWGGASSADFPTAPVTVSSGRGASLLEGMPPKEPLTTTSRSGVSPAGSLEKWGMEDRVRGRGLHGAAVVDVARSSGALGDDAVSVDAGTAPPPHSVFLANMSTKELLATAARLGVSTSGIVEKKEIMERITARGKNVEAAVDVAPSSGTTRDGTASAGIRTAPPLYSGGVGASPLDIMSVKELKTIASSVGVDISDVVEKRDIVGRIRGRFFVRALFDYNGVEDEELSFKAGDIITTDEGEYSGHGWMAGFCHGKKGLFPANYTQRFEDTEPHAVIGGNMHDAGDVKVAVDIRTEADRLRKQGKYADAGPLYLIAAKIQKKILGPDHQDVASTFNNRGKLLLLQGKFDEAGLLFERSVDIRQKALSPDHPDVAESLHGQGEVLYEQGKLDEAGLLFERSLEIRRKALGPDHPDVAESLHGQGEVLLMQGNYDEAGKLIERSLAIREKAQGPYHPDVAQSLNNRALLLEKQGNYDQAGKLYERSLAIREKALGPDHPDVAQSLNNRAGLLKAQGNFTEAEQLYERCQTIKEKVLGSDHPSLATTLNNRAELLREQGNNDEAGKLYERSLAIREKALGPDHPQVAQSLNNRALLLKAQGKLDEAGPLYVRATEIWEKALGPDHPQVATALNNRAGLLKAQGKLDEAGPLYVRATEIWEKALGPDHPQVATALNNRAELLRAQGKCDEAGPLYERSLAIREKVYGPDHPAVATALNNRALLLTKQGEYAEAGRLYLRAIEIGEKALGPDHPDLAVWLTNRAELLRAQGNYDQAGKLNERSLAIREKALGPDHPDVATSLIIMAVLLEDQRKYHEAMPLLERALTIQEKKLGENHPETANCKEWIKMVRNKVNKKRWF